MEFVKNWGIVAALIAVILIGLFYTLPLGLDHWDKARAQTRIEIKDMEAAADFLRGSRVRAAQIACATRFLPFSTAGDAR